eukprot:TRINITY_DN271_c5_g1_i2.p1 TRINITY_DN271_c5_g1~~TRINITY_DN271_c5_g1_i2.p1  ORF type:complete len:112 (+),score=15.39 TRINITY_DN271_c5_g1_i2:31-366(+)
MMDGWWKSLFGTRNKPLTGSKTDASKLGCVVKDTFDANLIGADLEPGLGRWKAVNAEWRKSDDSFAAKSEKKKLDVTGISECLISNTPFAKPIRLSDMIGILTEIWSEDGL